MNTIAFAASGIVPTCTGVGGGWRRTINTKISAGDDCPSRWRKANYYGVIFCIEWTLVIMMFKFVHLLVFPSMEQVIRMCEIYPEVTKNA